MIDGTATLRRGWAWFYRGGWATVGSLLAAATALLLLAARSALSEVALLVWVQVPVYLLHQFEEHVWPGGFQRLVNERLFSSPRPDWPLDDRTVFWANVPLTWVAFPASAALATFLDIRLGVWLAVFGVFNAAVHVLGAVRFRTYNPGLATGVLLAVPVGGYALFTFHRNGLLTGVVASASLALAVALHLLLALRVRQQLRAMNR